MNIILRIIIISIIIILIVSILQFMVSIHPPRYTSKNSPADYNLPYKNVSFKTSDKITIRGWLIESNKSKGTVIAGHGYPFDKGNILPVTKFLYPEYNILYYDHRYFGESDGFISTVGFKETKDVEAAVKFIKSRSNKPIALYGFSLSASSMLMADVKINGIIADSPYANLDMMIHRVYALYGPLRYPFVFTTKILSKLFLGINPDKVSPADSIKDSKTPIFIIHGSKDSQIPVENSYKLKEANPNIELWIIPSDHGMSYATDPNEYKRRIKVFLRKHMK